MVIKAKESWSEELIFWFGDIKSSGQGKTPPIKMLLQPIWNFQHEEDDRVEKINAEEMEKEPKDRKLIRGRSYVLTDMTTESLREDRKYVLPAGLFIIQMNSHQ